MKPNRQRTAPDPLAGTLFILGNFPSQFQTFIQREMVEMRRRGHPVNVFADTREDVEDLHPVIAEIKAGTIFRDEQLRWIPRGTLRGARRPLSFARSLRWALGLPHRSQYHRARFLTALLTAADIAAEVRRRGYRYIHAHFAGYQTEVAMCLSRLVGVPYGATWHAYGIWRDRNILPQKIEGARVILTCTKHNVRHLEGLCPASREKIALNYHGMELERLPAAQPIPRHETPKWLAVGRLIPKKGFNHLIEAAALLKGRGSPFLLSIAGDGPERHELERLISRYGLEESVKLLGEVPGARIFETLGTVRGLVAPSVRDASGDIDGIPNVLLEAMAMERPVIGTDFSGLPEVVRDGETGLLVPPGDPGAIADAMARLGDDVDFAVSCGASGRKLVETEFDVRTNVSRQIELLTEAQRKER